LFRTGVALATVLALAASAVGATPSLAQEQDAAQSGAVVRSASASGFGVASLQGNNNGIAGPAQPGDHVSTAVAVTIGSGWQEFSFTTVFAAARGCAPNDPSAPFCTPSAGGNSTFAGTPPWTFTGPATLTVTDAFTSGDVFQIFDFNQLIGTTSAATSGTNCSSDPSATSNPDVCLTNNALSHGTFVLGAGSHSITIVPQSIATGSFGGVGYFRVDSGATSACTLTQTVTKSGTTLNLSYTITTSSPATVGVFAAVGSSVIPIVVAGLPTLTTAINPTISIPNVPSIGTVGFLATISTPSGGILCSDFDLIAT
jgi:hypothetical protein